MYVMKSKNLNEEINRMKSLMGESLLYGNLVDRKLLLEQKGKWLDDVLKAITKNLKKGSEVKFKIRKGGDAEDVIQIKKGVDDGSLTFYKGGKSLGSNPTISDLVSSVGRRELDGLLGGVDSEKAVSDFLTGDDFYNAYDIIINDLKLQGFPVTKDFKKVIQDSGLGKKLDDYIFGQGADDFFNDGTGRVVIRSMDDIKTIHPDFYNYVNDIPGLQQKLDNALQNSQREFYDSETVDIARSINRLKNELIGDGNWNTGRGYSAIEKDDVIEITIPKSQVDFINDEYGLKFKEKDGEYVFEIDKGVYSNKEYNFIKNRVIDPQGIDTGSDVVGRVRTKKFINKQGANDLKAQSDISSKKFTGDYDINRIKRFFSSTDDVDIYQPSSLKSYLNKKFSYSDNPVWMNFMKSLGNFNTKKFGDYITTIFNNPSFSLKNNLKDTFSRVFRADFDVKKWIDEGFGIGDNITPTKKLNENQQKYVETVYQRSDGTEGGAFITKKDLTNNKSLVEEGYTEGMVYRNLELVPNWKDKLYTYIVGSSDKRSLLAPGTWVKVSFAKSDYNNWKKTVGRVIKNYAALGFGGGYYWLPMSYLNFVVGRIMMIFLNNTIQDILSSGIDIKTWDAGRFRIQCWHVVKDSIQNDVNISDRIKKDILGEIKGSESSDGEKPKEYMSPGIMTINKIASEIGVVEFGEGAITGTPPSYEWLGINDTEKDMLPSWDVIEKGDRKIDESQLTYPIDSFEAAGDDWKLVDYSDTRCLEINIKKDGSDWCRRSEDCIKYYFNLKCGEFSKWWEKNKIEIDVDDLTDSAIEAIWVWFTQDKSLIDWVKNFSEELSKKTIKDALTDIENAIDVDGDGTITTDDVVQGAENLRNKGLENISGQEPNNLNKNEMVRRMRNREANK